MIERSSFKMRARTVDHLGREQIADCPTAISELWKNAFDAYATEVSLDIFENSSNPVAVVKDNGHGMNKEDFFERWLVIGTESKATVEEVPLSDRKGLEKREKQGQKGIGRLSCANLGPTMLLVSKREQQDYIASLLDWRLFENPFLNLGDVVIPMIEVAKLEDVFDQLPSLIEALLENLTPKRNTTEDEQERESQNVEAQRIINAWRAFDKLPERKKANNAKDIINSISSCQFSVDHLPDWAGADGEVDCGTALMVSGINYDLRAQLASEPYNQSIKRTRKNFAETLANFIDPYVDLEDETLPDFYHQFAYKVTVWKNLFPTIVISRDKCISRRQVERLEHCLSGTVDEDGVFTGTVKAFGRILPDKVQILPKIDVEIPNRPNTRLGSFEIYIAAMEFEYGKSTHEKVEHDRIKELAELYAGFMIFRDGLRVLPYGRPDNDFFEIEERRTKHAGREFWNHRQILGRLAIKRRGNPNLRDKAGREGILDNRAAKALKDIVDNILMQSARKYFGTDSEVRKEILPEVREAKKQERDAENRRKLGEKNSREFKTKLRNQSALLPELLEDLHESARGITIDSDAELNAAQDMVAELKKRLLPATLPSAPRSMTPRQKERYSHYRTQAAEARSLHAKITQEVSEKVEKFRPTDPLFVLERQAGKSRNRLVGQLNQWKTTVRSLQAAEFQRIINLVDQRKSMFMDDAEAILQLFKIERETFYSAASKLTKLENDLSEENEAIFEPYLRAIESLKESIDLEHLATTGMEDLADARAELDKLNSLAQLGIAVEITGHDLQDFEDIIASGLSQLPDEVKDSKAVGDIRVGYEGLTDQLRFLSPLRLSRVRVERWITGEEIANYIAEFFAPTLKRNMIQFEPKPEFKNTRIYDQPSRLLPVFINLVNNSIYWLGTGDITNRKIVLDVKNEKVIVSDNGPGIQPEDIDNLFKLFFTTKIHGGRGVGLYLSKANLVAGGHSITYSTKPEYKVLNGANFIISLNGLEITNE